MTDTPNLALPLIAAGQAQKHVTHNEAIRALDALVQCAVLDRDLTAPPASPADGARYIVAAPATGAWAGKAGQIAAWQDGAWSFFAPRPGFLAFVADEALLYVYAGGGWVPVFAALAALQNLDRLGVGTSADAANPFAAKLDGALWTARPVPEGGTGDLRYTLNKEAAGNVLSLLFQSGYSGRAELGLVGDDDLHLKVSADGASWTEALRVGGSGHVGIGAAPGAERLSVAGNIVPALDNAYSLGTPSLRASTIYAATGVINTSDIRLKTDVEPIDPAVALSLLAKARPIAFRWRSGGSSADEPWPRAGRRRHFGWSAQDWQHALAEAGTDAGLLVGTDPDDPDTELGLRPDQIVAVLHAAMLELADRVDRLTVRLGALDAGPSR